MTGKTDFDRYIAHLMQALGHADRKSALVGYCNGLMFSTSRKSVEPMAKHIDPTRHGAIHQSLHHFVAKSQWSDQLLLQQVAQWVVPLMDFSTGGWWIVDDLAFPKQGVHSVGVELASHDRLRSHGRRSAFRGRSAAQLNRVALERRAIPAFTGRNQVAVSTSLACAKGSLPVAWQLYLPHSWIESDERRQRAGIPEGTEYSAMQTIALRQLQHLVEEGAPSHCVVAGARYGTSVEFRQGLSKLGLPYMLEVDSSATVKNMGTAAKPRHFRDQGDRLSSASEYFISSRRSSIWQLAMTLTGEQFHTVSWRESGKTRLMSHFAAIRVRCAAGDLQQGRLLPEEWLLIERTSNEVQPTRFFVSTLPIEASLNDLVHAARMGWRAKLDFEDMKRNLGLGQYEGRSWTGFHHHASLCIAAHGYILAQRLRAHANTGGS